MESPELRPLPPLARQTSGMNCGNGEVGSTADEEEEFFSPRGSSGWRESFSGTGSGSRRVLNSMAAGESFDGRTSGSSSCSCSSSSSPSRSHSVSLSSPASLSPTKGPEPNSPELSGLPESSSPPFMASIAANGRKSPLASSPSLSPSPERVQASSPPKSNASHGDLRSPSLSPLSSPPNGTLGNINEAGASDPNGIRSPSLSSSPSSPSTTPERGLEGFTGRTSPSVLDDSDKLKRQFLSPSSSPESDLAKNSDTSSPRISSSLSLSLPERVVDGCSEISPRASNVFDLKMQVLSPSPPSMSPVRDLVKNPDDETPRDSDASDLISFELDPKRRSLSSSTTPTSSPERVSLLEKKNNNYTNDNSNAKSSPSSLSSSSPPRISNASDQYPEFPVMIIPASLNLPQPPPPLVPPPPPPVPPPPPQPPKSYWENPSPSTPIANNNKPIMSKPPALIPPSMPFVFQNPTKPLSISPMELPPSSKTMEKIEEETPKPKLKPLHWDKVRASSDREMVWDQLRSSSFK